MPASETEQDQPQIKKKRLPATLVIVAVVTLVEGAGFYAATKLMGAGPQAAHGGEGGNYAEGEQPDQAGTTAEVELLKGFKVPNDKRGQPFIYDFDFYLKVPSADEEVLAEFVENRRGEISDRIARLVRAADPAMLHEAELKTLRLKVQQTISEILGDPEMILEVLIPRCVPIRAG